MDPLEYDLVPDVSSLFCCLYICKITSVPLLCKKSSKSPLSMAIPASVSNPKSSNAMASLSACNPNAGLWLVYTEKLSQQNKVKQYIELF